ncbi:MAG: carboxypeptidase regulatory-like domain-containing protein, partial [Candidatus Zixiibacteriota bacterium]
MKSVYILVLIFALSPVVSAQLDHDVGVSAIISPPETTNIFLNHPVSIEITNFGQNSESFNVYCEIYFADSTAITFYDILAVNNLAPGEVDTVTSWAEFSIRSIYGPEWIKNFYEYDIFSYSDLAGDQNPQNDTTYQRMVFVNESFLIFGDKDGLPVQVNIGSIIEIPVWGGTPSENNIDSICFVHIPVASDDSIIALRYPSIEMDPLDTLPVHSYFPDTLIGLWDARFFYDPAPDTHFVDWTVQGILGFAYLGGDPNEPLLTNGDTVLIGTYVMKTIFDSTLMGQTIFPLQNGFSILDGGLLWGFWDGITCVIPNASYNPLRFLSYDELGYVMGTVTDTSGSPVDEAVVSLVDAFRVDTTDLSGEYYLSWITPGIYTMEFYHPDYGSAFVNDVEITAGDTTVIDYVITDHDVGVSAIISPPDTTNIFKHHPITFEVNNYGTSVESFDVIFEIYIADSTGISFADTVEVINLGAGAADTLSGSKKFSIITLYPALFNFYEYDVIAYSTLSSDENSQNDTAYGEIVFLTESFFIVGGHDGFPFDVNIGSIIEIPIWGGTPPGNDRDTVDFMHIPMSSSDSLIDFRYPSIEMDPLDTLLAHSYFADLTLGPWDEHYFDYSRPDTSPYWTVQSIIAYRDLAGGPNPPIFTMGDTVLFATCVIKTIFDSTLMGNIHYAFQNGLDPVYGFLHWGLIDGVTPIYPNSSYGPIRFMTADELGYVMGIVTDTSGLPTDEAIVSLIDAFREDTTDISGEYYLPWITPGTYSMEFYHPDYGSAFVNDVEVLAGDTTIVDFQLGGGCDYLPGDANGDDNTNGLDVTYLVAYFKGGSPPPDQCDCPPHGIIYAAADANGSCATNGLDVTYMVSYFKGGP